MAGTFANRVVLVTGASRGIGLASARAFLAEGARVVMVSHNRSQLERAVASLGTRAIAVAGDTSDPKQCERMVHEAERKLGAPIDVLISNAGILRRDFVEDISVPDFEDSFRTNVGGAVWLAKALIPGMRQRGYGRIVLVASELGLIGAPSYGSYCMSKFALIGLAEVLAHELSGTAVHACAVCPGNVATVQMDEELAWGPTAGANREKALSPDFVAATILRAASETDQTVVLADKPTMRLSFDLMFLMPRRLRLRFIRDAYKSVLSEHGRRLAA